MASENYNIPFNIIYIPRLTVRECNIYNMKDSSLLPSSTERFKHRPSNLIAQKEQLIGLTTIAFESLLNQREVLV